MHHVCLLGRWGVVCMWVCLLVHVFVCTCMYVCKCVCVCMCPCKCVCLLVYMCVTTCVYMCACMKEDVGYGHQYEWKTYQAFESLLFNFASFCFLSSPMDFTWCLFPISVWCLFPISVWCLFPISVSSPTAGSSTPARDVDKTKEKVKVRPISFLLCSQTVSHDPG